MMNVPTLGGKAHIQRAKCLTLNVGARVINVASLLCVHSVQGYGSIIK